MTIKQKNNFLRLAKFILSGGMAATVEYSAFLLLVMFFGFDTVMANVFSFTIGLVMSFLLNKSWVFMDKGGIRRQLFHYVNLAFVNLILSTCILWMLVEGLLVPNYIAKFAVMAMVAVWNYVFLSRFIFKNSLTDSDVDRV